ncbi:MAG: aminotransferase class V-fold PLP-dependent enzyme [Dehalococcoidia bacterium]|nr:aminotransferase class V-fold PLP-dependent enzyme [Dehalococcoidia bacterium]
MTSDVIYLDHAATTPLRPEARAEMEPFLGRDFGNPSALYGLARRSSEAIDSARASIAKVLGCRPADIVLTSGGTESNNEAIKGVSLAQQLAGSGRHVITSRVEHHAVLHSCEFLEKFGFEITYLDVDRDGFIDLDDLGRALRPDTVLVTIMLANNEVGTIQPIAEAARIVREASARLGKTIPFHTDAVQAAGYLDLDVGDLGVDMLSLSAHKFGGPKGAGILFIRRRVPFLPLLSGGGQERRRRAGTEDVAGIVGAAIALEASERERPAAGAHAATLRDRLVHAVPRAVQGAELNGHPAMRLPNNTNFSFPGVEGDALVAALDQAGFAVGSGSACGSGSWEPSHVLLAMGVSLERAAGALRITVGRDTTPGDIEALLDHLPNVVARVRAELVPA